MLARILPKKSLIIIAAAMALAPTCLLAYAPTPALATAGINQTINFQGKVANSSGTNVVDGTYDFVFKIYDGASSSATNLFTENWTSSSLFSSTMSSAPASGGQSLVYSSDTNEATLAAGQILWNTTKKESVKVVSVNTASNIINISPTRQAWSTSDTVTNRIYVKDGLFTASINSLNHDLSGVDFNSDSIYLGINFNSDGEMKPRIQFSAVPYAFNSQKVNGVTVTNTTGTTPATGTTIKIGDNKTLQFNNSLTFAGTDGKTLTINNTLTFGGTDGTSFTLPATSGTLATSSATTGQVAFSTGTGTLAGDSGLFWDNTNKRLGVGTASPSQALDVTGKIAVNGTQLVYLPDQTSFAGSIFIGDGGGSLSHSSGIQGQRNVMLGLSAGKQMTTGGANVGMGYTALQNNTTGIANTAIGDAALSLNTTASFNTAVGASALNVNTTGATNTAVGALTLLSNTTGIGNTAVGYSTLASNTSGRANVATGPYALQANTTGNWNIAFGGDALETHTSGDYNIGIGESALVLHQTGASNIGIGYQSGYSNLTGSGNIFIGHQAGYSETGSNKLYIANSNTTSPLIYGDFAAGALTFNGKVGIGTNSASQALTLSNNSNIAVDMSSTATPTLTPSATGGSLATGTYYYIVTPLDGAGGEGLGNEASVVVTGPTGSVAVSWSSTGGASSYKIYRGTAAGTENTYYTSTSTSFTDTGAAGTAGTPPTSRTASINRFTANGASWLGGSNAALGIGTATPADAIHILKGSATDVGITIQNSFSTTGETASINFRTGNVSSTMGRVSLERINNTNSKLNLATIQSGTLTTGLTLDNAGLVGIGTSSPTGELAINGLLNVSLSGTLGATNGSPNIIGTSTTFTTSLSVGDAINVNGAAYTVGSITDDTHLTLTSNYTGSTRTGIAATVDPTFLTIANGAGSSVMKLTKTGYLGLGTSTGITARLTLAADTTPAGGIQFGSDTNLYRSAADTLKTDDVFVANGGLIIGSGGSKISKFLSTTTTWDPASAANATSTSTTVSVSGAALGDTVLVSFDQAVPAGVSLTGQVTASGTVTVTLSNLSGSSQDLTSGTLRVDILQH